jgi:hypothetical protein
MGEFEEGIEYERRQESISHYFWLGWVTLIIAPTFYFFSVLDFGTKVWDWAGFTICGCISLLLAYSEKKELEKRCLA